MTREALFEQILAKKSYLCIGLDTDLQRIPTHLLRYKNPILEFNKQIIAATHDLCVAYKPNLAFYEAHGAKGWKTLEKTLKYIPDQHFTIADAKRGDIGNTSKLYAKAFFETLNFDAITVAPYMGEDSVKPFLAFPEKWVIVLALTSNKGSQDFQTTIQQNNNTYSTPPMTLYEKVMLKVQQWGNEGNLMFVVGATHPEKFSEIRCIAPNHFLLVPGVGEQGGDLSALSQSALNDVCGLLVNASRNILYASSEKDFAEKARDAAMSLQKIMLEQLTRYDLKKI